MPEAPLPHIQTASGTGIAQATHGGTASVTIGYSSEQVATLFAQAIETVGRTLSITGDVVLANPTLNAEPPAAPELRLGRPVLEGRAAEIMDSGKCLSIFGDVGSGRTELARKLCESHPLVSWLDLEANGHLPFVAALDLASRSFDSVESSAGEQRDTTRSVLVIDNADAAVLDRTFEARIRSLAVDESLCLVLVTLHPLSMSLKLFSESVEVKRLGDDEVREMMELYGAPRAAFQDGLLNVAVGATHGMPDLVTLLLREWQSKEWKLDDAGWKEALRFDYAKDLRSETQRRLLATQDATTRELLYRLTLLNGDFGEEESSDVANVEPTIDRVHERLTTLSGNWLQRTQSERWKTSPLLAGMGSKNLPKLTQFSVHSAAADRVLSKKTLGPFDVTKAIGHWIQAERWNDAGLLYIRALEALRVASVDAYPGLLMSFWKGLPLPKEMHLWLKIYIRGLQTLIAIKRGEDHAYAIDDLSKLLAKAHKPREKMSTFAVSGMLAMSLVQDRPDQALPFILSAVRAQNEGPSQLQEQLNEHSASELYWVAAMRIKSRDGVLAWMRDVGTLAAEQRAELMRAEFAKPSALNLFDSLWIVEQTKPDNERDWSGVMACLRKCEEIASPWSEPLISACILRAQLCVRVVHLEETTVPQELAEQFYVSHTHDEVAQFIVADGVGTWFTDSNRWDLASTWITRAYGFGKADLPLQRQLTSLRYGQLLLREGAPSVVPYERAVSIAVESDQLSEFFEVKARAELATFFWKTGRTNDVFQTWSTVVRVVLAHREDNDEWKGLFMLVANNMSFYSTPNIQTAVDAQLVTEPFLGMFQNRGSQLIAKYRRPLVFLMAGGMAQWADYLGKEREAAEWAKVTTELASEAPGTSMPKMYQMHAIPFAIREHRFFDALRFANDSAEGMQSGFQLEPTDERYAEMETANRQKETYRPGARRTRLFLGLLLCLAEISIDAERSPMAVREQLQALRDEIAILSADDPEIWSVGIAVLDDLLDGTLRTQQDVQAALDKEGPDQDVSTILRAFGIWIAASDPASNLWFAQALTTSYLSTYFSSMGLLGLTLTLSIGKMWVAKIEHSPYLYRSPASTVGEIRSLAMEGRLGELMLIVARSLGISIKAESQATIRPCRTYVPLADRVPAAV